MDHYTKWAQNWSPPNLLEEDARVVELIDYENFCWNETLVQGCFFPFETAQVLSILLTMTIKDDIFCWQESRDRVYRTKSTYHMIMNSNNADPEVSSSSSPQLDKMWTKIWKLNIPPRSKHFLWRLLHNVLPIRKNLEHRGIGGAPICLRCCEAKKIIDHAIFHYKEIELLWFQSLLSIHTNSRPLNNANEWIRLFVLSAPKEAVEMLSIIAHGMWLDRNKLCFEGRKLEAYSIIYYALLVLQAYKKADEFSRTQQ